MLSIGYNWKYGEDLANIIFIGIRITAVTMDESYCMNDSKVR